MSNTVSWLFRTGDDFPDEVAEQIESWKVNSILQKIPGIPCPRGLVTYKDTSFGCTRSSKTPDQDWAA